MIGKIKGTLVEIEGNVGLIETTSGVFYNVYLTSSILTTVKPSDIVEIYTYLHVREDILALFGFKTKQEHKVFKMLLDVPGVGPKSAFGVVSFTKVDELIHAVQQNKADYFTKIPGLGRKTALKIILELANKFDSEFVLEQTYVSEDDKMAIDALVSLGFKATDAKQVLQKIPADVPMEDKIRKGIQILTGAK